jgi:DnaJ-class molecular chaperone
LAYRGGELRAPLLERGKSILVAIPPSTKDKQVFKFANRGFPSVRKPTEFGNFYLTVHLYDPGKIPQEFVKLLNEINAHMRK